MRTITPYMPNGCLKLCSGCGRPFVIREGNAEAIVGRDGGLYCYGRDCERGITAPHAFPVSRVLPLQALRLQASHRQTSQRQTAASPAYQ